MTTTPSHSRSYILIFIEIEFADVKFVKNYNTRRGIFHIAMII